LAEQEVGQHGVHDHGGGGLLACKRLIDAHVDVEVLRAGVVELLESTGDRVWSLYAPNLANGLVLVYS